MSVEIYGEDPATIGIDMILDEWMGRIKRSTKEDAQAAWLQLRTALDEAIAGKKETLVLRLKRIMLYGENVTSTEKQRIENEFLSEANIAPASPAWICGATDWWNFYNAHCQSRHRRL